MGHGFFGIAAAEHDHHSHFHDHAHETAAAASRASIGLVATLMGGMLILTSYYVQWYSPWRIEERTIDGVVQQVHEYEYSFQMDLVAAVGAALLGVRIIWHALRNLVSGHMHMDELVALAILAAFASKDYRAAGVIGFFLLLSELIETRTAIGARAAIESLIRLTPTRARVTGPDGEREVDVQELRIGQHVRVRPGDNIPVDGTVVTGESIVNQANVTGESLPVDKRPGDAVFSGTSNLTGALDIEVTKIGADTTLGRVQNLILQAERTRIPIMRLIDQYAVWYTPVVLMLAALVLYFNRADGSGLQKTIAMLVASCPCALIIATPTAIVAGLSCAARLGILIKNVAHLEAASRLTAVVFDKTGTLTTGVLHVTRLNPASGADPAALLFAAGSAEQLSNHPAARALVAVAREADLKLERPAKFEEVPGQGVVATVGGETVLVGRDTFLASRGVDLSGVSDAAGKAEGLGLLFVARGGRCLGFVGVEDRTRPAAKEAVQQLMAVGLRRVAMLTGDRRAVARKVAREMGCSEFKAECLPHEKLDLVEQMRREGHRVVVVGDGVNDAPALAAGDLGVAMGAAGSDIAINSASIALLNNDLTRLPFLVRLSRQTVRVIRQNLVFGVLFVVTIVTLGAFGIVTPIMAAVLHTASSFVVVFNSARLVRYGEEQATHEQVLAAETGSPGAALAPA
ncbi:MAG: cation-translocating P-type ATPase [Phycisphaerae bacterium]